MISFIIEFNMLNLLNLPQHLNLYMIEPTVSSFRKSMDNTKTYTINEFLKSPNFLPSVYIIFKLLMPHISLKLDFI